MLENVERIIWKRPSDKKSISRLRIFYRNLTLMDRLVGRVTGDSLIETMSWAAPEEGIQHAEMDRKRVSSCCPKIACTLSVLYCKFMSFLFLLEYLKCAMTSSNFLNLKMPH